MTDVAASVLALIAFALGLHVGVTLAELRALRRGGELWKEAHDTLARTRGSLARFSALERFTLTVEIPGAGVLVIHSEAEEEPPAELEKPTDNHQADEDPPWQK